MIKEKTIFDIQTINNNTKYIKWYLKLIEKAKNNNIEKKYTEKHHILPKSMFPNFIHHKDNIIKLFPRQHYIAHLLLAKAYPNNDKIVYAAYMLANKQSPNNKRSYKVNSRMYEYLKIQNAKFNSQRVKKQIKGTIVAKCLITEKIHRITKEEFYNSSNLVGVSFGKKIKFSNEHKENIGKANKGKLKGIPKSEEHKQKISKSHIGIKHTKKTKEKLSEIFSKKYIVIHPDGKEEIITNLKHFMDLHGLDTNVYHVAAGRKKSTKGFKIKKYESKIDDIKDFFHSIGIDMQSTRKILSKGYELDGYNEERKIAFEYCGLYWHCELNQKNKNYHYNKYKECMEKDIHLFTIYENEWRDRKSQLKNFIKGSLGIYKHRLYARDCEIITIHQNDKRINDFYNQFHIQGRPSSYIFTNCLFHKGKLIGAMSFGKHHRQNGNQSALILNRLCWREDYTVIGGSKRLFSKVPKNTEIISWSDNRFAKGGVYERLGFTLEQEYKPSYDYVNNLGELKAKQSMTKRKINANENQKEYEKAAELGWYRIFDCGKKKWIINI